MSLVPESLRKHPRSIITFVYFGITAFGITEIARTDSERDRWLLVYTASLLKNFM